MRKLQEELQERIHNEIASEINQTIIHIKLHHLNLSNQPTEQQAKILEARKKVPEPQWDHIISLLERTHLEIIQCRRPFKRY